MYLSDLTFIEEGTPNFTENGLLNFAKMRMVRRVESTILVVATGSYNYLHAMWFSVMPTEPPVTEEIELDCEES